MQFVSAGSAQHLDGIQGAVLCSGTNNSGRWCATTVQALPEASPFASSACSCITGTTHGGVATRCSTLARRRSARLRRYVLVSSAPSCRVYIDCTSLSTTILWQRRNARSANSTSSPSETLANDSSRPRNVPYARLLQRTMPLPSLASCISSLGRAAT